LSYISIIARLVTITVFIDGGIPYCGLVMAFIYGCRVARMNVFRGGLGLIIGSGIIAVHLLVKAADDSRIRSVI
jgi:hypothetical protein